MLSSSKSLIEMLKRTSRGQADPEFLNSTDWYSSLAGQFHQNVIIQPTDCHSVQKDGTRHSHLTYININTSPKGKKQMRVSCQKKISTCLYPQGDCHTNRLKANSPSLPKSSWGQFFMMMMILSTS